MNKTEIINQLKDLIKDRESFMTEDSVTEEDIFYKDKVALEKAIEIMNTQEQDMNKLISYIATKENKDFEQVRKEFGIV